MALEDLTDAGEPGETSSAPMYMQAAGIHSMATSRETGILDSISNAPRFWGMAIGSGLTSMANGFVSVGNLFQGAEEKSKALNFGKWINEYDTDWGKYYRENADSIDTWGFVATSFVPGLGGVKALNMGQKALTVAASSGNMGKGMSWATGLLVPKTEALINKAAVQMAARTEGFKLTQREVLKAVGSKFHQNALEAAAFEVAVLGTMHQAPFFADMDTGDIIANMGVGIALGGILGGALAIPGVKRGIMKETTRLDEAGQVARYQEAMPSAVPADVKMYVGFKNRQAIDDFLANPQGETPDIINSNAAAARTTRQSIDNQLRTELRGLNSEASTSMPKVSRETGKANDLGNYYADQIIGMENRSAQAFSLGLDKVGRVAAVPKVVNTATIADDVGGSVLAKVTQPEEGWTFARLYGAGKGDILEQVNMPKALPLADTVVTKTGESIEDAIKRMMVKSNPTLREEVRVSLSSVALETVQLRYMRAAEEGFNFNFKKPVQLGYEDIPAQEALLKTLENSTDITTVPNGIKLMTPRGRVDAEVRTASELRDAIMQNKERMREEMVAAKMDPHEISERLNISPGYVTGLEVSPTKIDDMFYRQKLAKELELDNHAQLFHRPQYMGMKVAKREGDANFELRADGELMTEGYRKVAQDGIDNAVASTGAILGGPDNKYKALIDSLLDASSLNEVALAVNRFGPEGGGLISFVNGNYMSPTAKLQYIGNTVSKLDSTLQGQNAEFLKSSLDLIRGNTAAAAEYGVVAAKVQRSAQAYVQEEGGLVLRSIRDYEKAVAAGDSVPKFPTIPAGVEERIKINSPEVKELISRSSQLNAGRIEARKNLLASQGKESAIDPEVVYFPKPDPKRFKHFALVSDPTLTGAGQTTMIHAATRDALQKMKADINANFPEYRVVTNYESRDYHKALGDYEASKTIREDYIDSNLASRGINSPFVPRTDGNFIADELLTWHNQQARKMNREIVGTKYEQAFRELELKGREYSSLDSAQYTSMHELVTASKENPYLDMIKLALNVSRESDYGMLHTANQWADSAVTGLWNRGASMLQKSRSVEDLEAISNVFKEHGFQTAPYTAMLHAHVNHPAGQAMLSKFVRATQGFLATTFLRLDWLNAVNNKLGSLILTSTELKTLTDGIMKGNAESAGELAALAKVKVPGTNDSILAPGKLMARAFQDFWQRPELLAEAKRLGFVTDSLTAARGMVDDLSLTGNETGAQLSSKMRKMVDGAKWLGEKGGVITGNEMVESLNRFVAWRVSGLIGEIAVKAGVVDAREVRVIQNTFVNRTQVNLNAVQRPQLFQGPIGMAIGLFQSYQFNMMQQMMRYIQPGAQKSAAMLAGMQGSFYGLNGLPGFQLINDYVIGQAAGNNQHNDIYSSVFAGAGPDAAEWIMYGAPSNMLNVNLFTRGDLTPQHPTVVPSSVADLPVIAKTAQFFGNLKQTVSNVAGGVGVWNSLLTGLEHNSVNRPLSGLAQVLRAGTDGSGKVYSTDKAGNLLSANDFMSLATLGRLAGGRPLDEAVARDQMWRTNQYRGADIERRKALGVQAARMFAADQDADVGPEFMEKYVESGGKQAGFNKWMMNQMTRATTSQAELARQKLSDPYARRMQLLMGGMDENDQTLYTN